MAANSTIKFKCWYSAICEKPQNVVWLGRSNPSVRAEGCGYRYYCEPEDEDVARQQFEEFHKENLKKQADYYSQPWV